MALQKPLGFTNSKYFESPESLEGFEQVRTWLSYYCKKVSSNALINYCYST